MKLIKKYKLNILCLIIGLLLGLIIMSFQIKKVNVPLEENNTIISFDNKTITSDEYYQVIKNKLSIDTILDLIDDKLLSDIYTIDDNKLKDLQKEMQETLKLYYEYYDTNEEDFLSNNGFKDKNDFLEYLILNEKRNLYLKGYLKKKITNNDINNYYLRQMNNDFEIMYLKGSNDILSEILTQLNSGTTLESILKQYKNIAYTNLGFISFDNTEINSDIYNDALALEENSYTKSLRSINNEYYIIFKGQIKEKDDIKVLRERILNKIIENKINNDTDGKLQKEALINLRKEKGIIFYDTYLNNLYQNYLKN